MQNLKMGSGGLRTNENTNNMFVQALDAKTECGLYVYAIELGGCAQSALQITVLRAETDILRSREIIFFSDFLALLAWKFSPL
jgi:hypothetical protein